jgi:hypothetical protein
MYLLFVERRDGKAAVVKLCNTRTVCQNTINIALSEKTTSMLRLRHTSTVADKIIEAKKLVAGVSAHVKTLEDKFKALSKVKVTQSKFKIVLEKLFPDLEVNKHQQSVAAQIATNFMSNDNNAIPSVAGSAYNLVNAVTQYVDHQKIGFKGGDADTRRAESALFGAGDEYKRAALDTICAVMDVTSTSAADNALLDSILAKVAL